MEALKLIALDRDDLEVVSTHLQDALVKTSDIIWRPGEQRLVMALDRFDWECAYCGKPMFQRRRTALRFERVRACKCRNISADGETILNLLAVEFHESDPPGGHVILTFSGGGALRLDVECLEVELADLGPVWATDCCPAHIEVSESDRTVA